MAVQFPTSPTNGQQLTSDGKTYTYSAAQNAWNITGTTDPADILYTRAEIVAIQNQTTFNVDYNSDYPVEIFVNGIQFLSTDYTATDGSTVVFNTALDAGAEVVIMYATSSIRDSVDYSDLTNIPIIPADVSDLTDTTSLLGGDIDLTAIDQSIVPDTDVAYDLGSSTKRWKDLYLSGNTLVLGDTSISAVDGQLSVTSPSNPSPVAIGSGSSGAPSKEFTVASDVTDGDIIVVNTDGTVEAASTVTLYQTSGIGAYSNAPSTPVENGTGHGSTCYVPWLDKYYAVYPVVNKYFELFEVSLDGQTLTYKADFAGGNQYNEPLHVLVEENTKQLFIFSTSNNQNKGIQIFSVQFNGPGDTVSGTTYVGQPVYSSAIINGEKDRQWAADSYYDESTGNILIGLVHGKTSTSMGALMFVTDGTAVTTIDSANSGLAVISGPTGTSYDYRGSVFRVPGTNYWAFAFHNGTGYLYEVNWDGTTTAPTLTYKQGWTGVAGWAWDGVDRLYGYGFSGNYFYSKYSILYGGGWSTPTGSYWTWPGFAAHQGQAYITSITTDESATADPSNMNVAFHGNTNKTNSTTVDVITLGDYSGRYKVALMTQFDLVNQVVTGSYMTEIPAYYGGNIYNTLPANKTVNYNSAKGTWTWIDNNSGQFQIVNVADSVTIRTGETKPIIGTAGSTVTAGNSLSVNLLSTVVDTFSGLTVGQKYYTDGEGTITTTSTNNRLLGSAISSTEILPTLAAAEPVAEPFITQESDITNIIDATYINSQVTIPAGSKEVWVELVAPTDLDQTLTTLNIDSSEPWFNTYSKIRIYMTGTDLIVYPTTSSGYINMTDFRIALRKNSSDLVNFSYRTAGDVYDIGTRTTSNYVYTGYGEPFHTSYYPRIYGRDYNHSQLPGTSEQAMTFVFDLVSTPVGTGEFTSVHIEYDLVHATGRSGHQYMQRQDGTMLLYSTNTTTNLTRFYNDTDTVGLNLYLGNTNLKWGGQYTVLGLQRIDTLRG